MPIAPYASARLQLNGGALLTGKQLATGGEVVQLSADPAGAPGVTQWRWEIRDYPSAFTVPSGWSTAPDGTYYSTAQTPPTFTLLSNANWGKYIVWLIVNGGGPFLTGRESAAQLVSIAALTDSSIDISVPSVNGVLDLARYEDDWVPDQKSNLRKLQNALAAGGGGGGVTAHAALTGLGNDDHTQYAILTGIRAFTGNQSMGGYKLTSLGTPTTGTDAATKAYVDASSAGVSDHGSLLGLTDDDHAQYDLTSRPIASYAGAANTLVLADARRHVRVTHGSATVLTVPPNASVAFPIGALIFGAQAGVGSLSVAAGVGVTLNGPLTVGGQWRWFWLKKVAADQWDVFVGGAGLLVSGTPSVGMVPKWNGYGAAWAPLANYDITAFSAVVAAVEVGATVTNPAFTAAHNATPLTLVLTNNKTAEAKNVVGTPTSFASSAGSQVLNTVGASWSFTLTGSDGNTPDVMIATIYARQRNFGGKVTPGTTSPATLAAAATYTTLGSSGAFSFTVTDGGTNEIQFMRRTAYGTPSSVKDHATGLGVSFTLVANTSYTNAQGFTENFNIYKLDVPVNGTLTLDVAA